MTASFDLEEVLDMTKPDAKALYCLASVPSLQKFVDMGAYTAQDDGSFAPKFPGMKTISYEGLKGVGVRF